MPAALRNLYRLLEEDQKYDSRARAQVEEEGEEAPMFHLVPSHLRRLENIELRDRLVKPIEFGVADTESGEHERLVFFGGHFSCFRTMHLSHWLVACAQSP